MHANNAGHVPYFNDNNFINMMISLFVHEIIETFWKAALLFNKKGKLSLIHCKQTLFIK